MMQPIAYAAHVADTFRRHGHPDIALGQMAYMKNQFEFFGLKMPVWTSLAKQIVAEHGIPSGHDLAALVRLCYDDAHREMQYFALFLVEKTLKKQPTEWIDLLEELIGERSWWDTVDWLAKLVGQHFRRYPALIGPTVARWMDSGHLWLQRVCIIFQLTYRADTDTELLFSCIRRVASSKEFFLQKAAGWALRQHTRTDAEAVRAFVASTSLAPLTRREALRLVGD
jgi:3-methyladenine DNA glycosylase AlkD